MYGRPQCLGKKLKQEIGSHGWFYSRVIWKREQPAKAGLEAKGRVVWEGQKDRSPGDQLGNMVVTWAQEVRAQGGWCGSGEEEPLCSRERQSQGSSEELPSLPLSSCPPLPPA